mmetsp:Transcript_34453/g.78590  ORF Transcript_34453/g.78590 Transcript_34453/m.78590 type:complete len:577 (-) Transcript_34453:43-1773(-)
MSDEMLDTLEEDFTEGIRDAPRNVEARAVQEAKWAGDYDGRGHWSLREAYRIYRDRLQVAQEDFRLVLDLFDSYHDKTSLFFGVHWWLLEKIVDYAFGQGGTVSFLMKCHRPNPIRHPTFTIAARKRPLLKFEDVAGDWDCVLADEERARVICHDGRLHRTGRRLELTHKHFLLNQVYSETTTDDHFYADTVQPLVQRVLSGHEATLICYGQTGTGKTHTFNACWQRIGADMVGKTISVTFFEIHGKGCFDLLQERKECFLRADADERVHIRGATTATITPESSADLVDLLAPAMGLRVTEATERNPISSRSHAVCILDVHDYGTLRLVDLAGSERNYETHYMTAQQHREFADINQSLMALKECFRQHAQMVRQKPGRLPYRRSRLTRVLRSCFTDETHQTVIVAMLSPTATDLLHSSNSLLQVTQMSKELSAAKVECTVELPLFRFNTSTPVWEWSVDDVDKWIKSLDNGRFKYMVLPPNMDGPRLLQLATQDLGTVFEQAIRTARVGTEGGAWNEAAGGEAGRRAGRLLFEAVRREALQWHNGDQRLKEAQRLGALALEQQRLAFAQQLDLDLD